MTSGARLQPFPHIPGEVVPMKLEILRVKEKEGSRRFPRRRGAIRMVWIEGEAPKSPLSGGFTLGAAPTL